MEEERQVQEEREAHSLREKEEQLRQMEVREGGLGLFYTPQILDIFPRTS